MPTSETHAAAADGCPACAEGFGPACAILWTPIHPITWALPFVGHMGITDSTGRLHDWGGGPITPSYPAEMMFGRPARFIQCDPLTLNGGTEAWDAAIDRADGEYLHNMHCMVLGSDCHSHVARVLNILRYRGVAYHNKVELAAWVFFVGRYVDLWAILRTWLGFVVLGIIVLCVKLVPN